MIRSPGWSETGPGRSFLSGSWAPTICAGFHFGGAGGTLRDWRRSPWWIVGIDSALNVCRGRVEAVSRSRKAMRRALPGGARRRSYSCMDRALISSTAIRARQARDEDGRGHGQPRSRFPTFVVAPAGQLKTGPRGSCSWRIEASSQLHKDTNADILASRRSGRVAQQPRQSDPRNRTSTSSRKRC